MTCVVVNGDFEAGETGWYIGATLPVTVAVLGVPGAHYLRIEAT